MKIKIIKVKDSGNEMMEADIVFFEVVEGETDALSVKYFIEESSNSICNFSYNENSKSGNFIDMNFEFKENEIIE